MKLFECAVCGCQVIKNDWPFCSTGHKEAPMGLLERLGNSEHQETLAAQNRRKKHPQKQRNLRGHFGLERVAATILSGWGTCRGGTAGPLGTQIYSSKRKNTWYSL
jgi:hypothetical protein